MKYPVAARSGASISLQNGDQVTTVPLYSREGVELLSALRLKQAAEFKLMYEPSWMGVQIIQLPEDILALQELVWQLKPDLIVECGIAHGGSLILLASILEIIGKGHVLGVDIEIRPHNRATIEAHSLSRHISLIEGSSVDGSFVARMRYSARPPSLW